MSSTGHPRDNVRKPVDRRISRTRRSIDAAFVSLLRERGYESVGVSDIVREADVGRATFYEHYASKDQLLRAQLRRVLRSTLRAGVDRSDLFDATRLFAHVREVPILYRLVAGRSSVTRSQLILQDVVQEHAAALLDERLAAGAVVHAPLTPSVVCRLVAANLAALLSWWTENGMRESADEMQALFEASVGGMVASTDPWAPR